MRVFLNLNNKKLFVEAECQSHTTDVQQTLEPSALRIDGCCVNSSLPELLTHFKAGLWSKPC